MNFQTPTTEQLIKFVEDNELNIFEYHNEQNDDIIHDLMDAETYVLDNYISLVEDWQKEQISIEGKTAAQNKVCVFDCKYELGSEEEDVWMAAYIVEDKKKFDKYI